MTIDEAKIKIEELACYARTKGWDDEYTEAVNMIIKALEQQPTDAVSRQAVLEQTYLWSKDESLRVTNPFDYLRKRINSLSPVTLQPRMGQWEYVQYEGFCGNWHCSECRTIISHMPEEIDNTPIYKWCPMCGCKMQEV